MSLRQLFLDGEPDLPRLYAYPDGRWLRANMVATADGAASLAGVTQGISSDTDRRVFALLRTLCDVILVGASTAREEKYKPARPQELWSHLRAGRPPTPPIAVVTGRLDLDPDSPLITAAPRDARTILITTASAPAARRDQLARHAEIIVAGQDTVDLATAVDALAERGHRRMLAEGGPHLLAQLAEAGLLDELCLTIGPLMAGPGAPRIVAGTPGTGTATPLPLTLAHVLEDESFLLCRYIRKDGLWAGQQAPLEPGCHRRGAVVDAELGVDVQQVRLDRGLADEQAGGGLAVRAALRDQAQDVEFALAERFPGRLPDLAEEPGGDRGRQDGLAAARSTASRPLAASPATSNSPLASKMPRSPSRTTGWSSAISSRMVWLTSTPQPRSPAATGPAEWRAGWPIRRCPPPVLTRSPAARPAG